MNGGLKWLTVCVTMIAASAGVLPAADKITERVENSVAVYRELINTPDKKIPLELLEDCRAVMIIPGVKKAAFGFGGRHGRGVVSVRRGRGSWSPPGFVSLSGGSFGFQIGGSSSDLVLFIMSERGTESLLKSRFTLGGDVNLAAGPVGRAAEAGVDIGFDADIYAYARSKGLFAGIALDGSVISEDEEAAEKFYGRKLGIKTIVFDREVPEVPAAAVELMSLLP